MLDYRTTIGLSLVCLCLVGLVLWERGAATTSQLQERRGRVLPSFVRARVTELELVRQGEAPVAMRREPAAGASSDRASERWSLTAPVSARADRDAVEAMLGTLEWLSIERTLTGLTPTERSRLGFDEPRFEVRMRGTGDLRLQVGADVGRGGGVYVSTGEASDSVYVVSDELVTALDHEADHFRSKRLFPDLGRDAVATIALRTAPRTDASDVHAGAVEVRLSRVDERFAMEPPFERAWASERAVDRLLGTLRDVEATRFIAESLSGEAAIYGFDEPYRMLRVRHRDAFHTLFVGKPCRRHADERFAFATSVEAPAREADGGERAGEQAPSVGPRPAGSGPVVCVRTSDLEGLDLSPVQMRETRVVPLRADQVEAVRFEHGGTPFTLRRASAEGGGWAMLVGDQSPEAADAAAVNAYLASLRSMEVDAFGRAGELTARVPANPRAKVTFQRTDSDEGWELAFGRQTEAGTWVRRRREAIPVRVGPAARETLSVRPLRFRRRRLFAEVSAAATWVEIRHAGRVQRAERAEGGDWQLVAPARAPADAPAARAVAASLAALRAQRFVSERALGEHGIDPPRSVVEAGFGEETTLLLRVGAETAGGVFGQVGGDPAVFVVDGENLAALTKELASLEALSLPAEEIRSLVASRRGQTLWALVREGRAFRDAAGQAVAPERAETITQALAVVRASRTLETAPSPPALSLAVRTADDADIGYEFGPAADGKAWARRSDIDLVYEVTSDIVAAIERFAAR